MIQMNPKEVKSKVDNSAVKDKFKRNLQSAYDILQQNLIEICNTYTEESLKESTGESHQKTETETLERLQTIIKLTANNFNENNDVFSLLNMMESYVISKENEGKSMKELHKDYETAMGRLRYNLEAQRRDVANKKIMIGKLEQDIRMQNHEIRQKNLVIYNLDEEIRDQKFKFKEKNQIIEKLDADIKNHKQQIGKKTQIIEQTNNDIKSLKAKVAELEKLIAMMDDNSENNKRELAVLMTRIQMMEENNENHNREVAEMEMRIKTMEENSENHKREVADLQMRIQTMEENSENHKSELAEKNTLIEQMRLDMEKKSNENEDKVFGILETVESCVKPKVVEGEDKDTSLTLNKELISQTELHSALKNMISGLIEAFGPNSDEIKDEISSLVESVEPCLKSMVLPDNKDEFAECFFSLESIKDNSISENKFKAILGNLINGLSGTLGELQNEKTSVTEKQKISEDIKNNDQTAQIADLESKINKLEIKNEESQRIISQLENKIKFSEQHDAKDEQYEKLLNSLKTKKQEIRDRDIKIENLETQIADFENKMRRLEKEIRSQKKELAETINELEESEKLKEEVEKKYKLSLREKNKEMKTTDFENIEKYLDEIKSLKEALRKEERDSRNKDNTIEELQRGNENSKLLTTKCKELETNLQKLKFESEARYDEIVRQNDEEMKKKNDAIQTMRTKMKMKNDDNPDPVELKRLNAEIRRKDNEIEHINEKYKNINEAYEKLCNENDLSKKEINILKSDLDNIKRLNFSRRPSEIPNENINNRNMEFNQFPNWWRAHMTS